MKTFRQVVDERNPKKTISLIVVISLVVGMISIGIGYKYNSSKNIVHALVEDENEKEVTSNIDALDLTNDSESVYVIQNPDGSEKKKILSKTKGDKNTQTNIDTDIPVTQTITYYLDGKKIEPNDIAGKSGKVEIKFNYKNLSASQNGSFVPFLALTGMVIDHNVFKNIEITSGKIINDADKFVVVGLALPGVKDYLGLSKDIINISDSFSIKGDVKKFELSTTMSLVTNDFFNDIDTTSVNSVTDLLDNMDKLTDGMNQLITGSKKLADGANELGAGGAALSSGATKLANGANSLYTGSVKLDEGVDTLGASLKEASIGAGQLGDGIRTAETSIKTTLQSTMTEFATTAQLTAQQQQILQQYMQGLSGGIDFSQLAGGADNLKNGLGTAVGALTYTGTNQTIKDASSAIRVGLGENQGSDLKSGLTSLGNGINQAAGGISQIQNGANELYNGLVKYNDEGIKAITELASDEITGISNKLNSMIESSKKYVSYSDRKATKGSVKFIFRTDGIKLK